MPAAPDVSTDPRCSPLMALFCTSVLGGSPPPPPAECCLLPPLRTDRLAQQPSPGQTALFLTLFSSQVVFSWLWNELLRM